MAGFASAIAGAGDAAARHGQQIRQLVEQRRGDLANLFEKLYTEETDPNLQALYGQHAIGIRTGDLAKELPKAIKTLQNHYQGNVALAQSPLGQMIKPPGQPQMRPAPAGPGQVAGGTIKPIEEAQNRAVAAQTPTSPVQPQSPEQNFTPIGGSSPVPQPAPQAQAQAPAQPIPPPGQSSGIPSGFPTPVSSQDVIAKYMQNPMWQTIAGRKMLEPLMREEIQQNQELARALQAQQAGLAYRRAGAEEIMGSPEYTGLPNNLRGIVGTQIRAAEHNFPNINIPAQGFQYRFMGQNVPGSSAPPGQVDKFGNPVDAQKLYRIEESPFGGAQWVEQPPLTTQAQTAGGVSTFNRLTGAPIAPLQGAVPPSQNAVQAITLPNGQEEFARKIPGTSAGVNVTMQPTTTTGERLVQDTDPNTGLPIQRVEPFTSTRTRGGAIPAPGAGTTTSTRGAGIPAPSGGTHVPVGGRIFSKPLTPEQTLHVQQNAKQVNTTINRAESILKQSSLLDSLLESGKLKLGTDTHGDLTALATRALNLSPEESKFIADFNSLVENVNLLRGPLGATGFRGPEAFAALQAQIGNLLKNPAITRDTLRNFIEELNNQLKPTAPYLPKGERPGAAPPSGVTHRFNPTTGKIETVPSVSK